jgi:diguanylate cyclase (GGDEF)-like protein
MSVTHEHMRRIHLRLKTLLQMQSDIDVFAEMVPNLRLDPLTELPSRAGILSLADRLLRQPSVNVALIVFDLDDFKRVNERYLLPGGDHVLCRLAELLAGLLKPNEYAGRFGGDRFLILAEDADREQATMLAEWLRTAIAEAPFAYKDEPIKVTATFGIAVADAAGSVELRSLLDMAEAELDAAKLDGGILERAGRQLGVVSADSPIPWSLSVSVLVSDRPSKRCLCFCLPSTLR